MIQSAAPTANVAVAINGNVHGGQQAVSGAHVYLFAAGSTGYGSASTSLLTSGGTGVTLDGSGNGYVTTDANGNFTMAGDVNCGANTTSETYMLAVGGNPGLPGTVNNTAITLMAGTGLCASLSSSTQVAITEVSTVATVTALQQFMTSPTAIGTSATNSIGLINAFSMINNLASVYTTGANITSTALATTPNGRGTVPQTKINTLANILAPCVNSSSASSSACTSLFGAVPASLVQETASAMLLIAKNPTINVSNLFGLTNAAAPYSPSLTTVPQSFAIGVTYSGAGIAYPGAIAVDANQDVWITNSPATSGQSGTESIVGLTPNGAALSGAAGYTANVHAPAGIAIDSTGDIWTTERQLTPSAASILRMTQGGVTVSGFPYTTNLNTPSGVAIDASNNAYVTDAAINGVGAIYQLSPTGSLLQTITSTSLVTPTGDALDLTGNLIVAGNSSSSIGKFTSSGTQVSNLTGGGLVNPSAISMDATNQAWTVNNNDSVSIFNTVTGAAVSPSSGYNVNLDQATIISIAGDGTAWIATCNNLCDSHNTGADALIHTNSAGTTLNSGVYPQQNGIVDAAFGGSQGTAIDQSGNVWVSNTFKSSITEIVGVAAPVKTPLLGATVGAKP